MLDVSKAPQLSVVADTLAPNGIGGMAATTSVVKTIRGWIDLLSGDERTDNLAIMEVSTHVLITNYQTGITRANRIIDEDGNEYDITLVDDPMKLHRHLEIFLKFTGVRA